MTAFGETLVQGIAFFLLASLLVAGIWIGASAFEAAAYRRLTGKQVTTWDAMFLELRVQEPVREQVSDG